MSENPQFYLLVYCLTHEEKQRGSRYPSIGFFVKLKRQYRSKDDALSKEEHAKNDYVMDCSKLDNKRIYPSLDIFDEKEYELNKSNLLFQNWKLMKL